jgi:DNA-binding SARP family transcriptional activator/tetratricopeptide (TPR) repeat protein
VGSDVGHGGVTMGTSENAGVQVKLAGVFTVVRDGVPIVGVELGSLKARVLLKLLAIEREHTLPARRIAAVLWGQDAPAHAVANVATLVSRLRRVLGAGIIEGGRTGYRLGRPPAVEVDLDVARRLVDEAERRLTGNEPGLAVAAVSRAREVLAADVAVEDEPDADWVEPVRVEFAALVRRGRHALAAGALAVGAYREARAAGQAAVTADPLDETACRLLMRAHQALGEPGRALAAYAGLRDLLAVDLGADPAPETQALHLAVLREELAPPESGAGGSAYRAAESVGLVGRTGELRRLREAWNSAAAGLPALMLVVGEAGIGKTRLVEELARIAGATGGTVLRVRCYEAERSLFLQPIVEAVMSATRILAPAAVRLAAGDAAATLASVVPEAARVLEAPAANGTVPVTEERRRAYEALATFLRGIASGTPLLVSLDDLHNAGRSTIEFLHYLARHGGNARLLIVATARIEHERDVVDPLAGVAGRIELGMLPAAAVRQLAVAAGLADQAEHVLIRTRGHALFVVETLRALMSPDTGVPASLQDAVVSRVGALPRPVEDFLRAGAVLGASFDLFTVAGVLGEPLPAVVACGEDALAARLLVVAGRDYEFCNDVVREVLYATTPPPTRLAYHVRAADLLANQPEALAAHAGAVEDWPRAARAWLLAGEQALKRLAARDGEELLSLSVEAAERANDLDVRGRALIARAQARDVLADYDGVIADLKDAVAAAREVGDQRLEMIALRALGGDAMVALGRPIQQATVWLERGMRLATALGDRGMEADLLGRLAILATNRLRFDEAVEHGRRALAVARASGEDDALAAALDGRKTSLAYLGEVADLRAVLGELEPLLRRRGDHLRLHWALFESGFVPLAAGDSAAAANCFERALEANRRSGIAAFIGWHTAHLGWLARLQGRYADAIALGRQSVALSEQTPHAWCAAMSAAMLGTTLLEVGARAESVELLDRGRRLAERDGAEAYLLHCLGPLAEASGSPDVLADADRMLEAISAPPGSAWLLGDGAYLAVARAWLAYGEPERARAVLAPLLDAAARVPWVFPLAGGCLVDGLSAAMLGLSEEAQTQLMRAAELAERFLLPRIREDAAAALGGTAR